MRLQRRSGQLELFLPRSRLQSEVRIQRKSRELLIEETPHGVGRKRCKIWRPSKFDALLACENSCLTFCEHPFLYSLVEVLRRAYWHWQEHKQQTSNHKYVFNTWKIFKKTSIAFVKNQTNQLFSPCRRFLEIGLIEQRSVEIGLIEQRLAEAFFQNRCYCCKHSTETKRPQSTTRAPTKCFKITKPRW